MKLKTSHNQSKNSPPPRFRKPPFTVWLGIGILLAFFLHGLYISNLTPERIYKGFFRLGAFLAEAFPPKPDRLINIIKATIETFEMALVGTVFGALFSLPLSFLAAKNTSPNGLIYRFSRGFITLLRVIPDLVWGLLFIVVVGLGSISSMRSAKNLPQKPITSTIIAKIPAPAPKPTTTINSKAQTRSGITRNRVIKPLLKL